MQPFRSRMGVRKQIALIAHDNRKGDLLEWARYNRGTLSEHDLYATGTTGSLLAAELGLGISRFVSGPLGGDQQVGAAIVEGRIDFVIFFWDPLEPHPHDVDVKALLRIAVVYNIPIACNRSSADFLLSSTLMAEPYERRIMDYEALVGSGLTPYAVSSWYSSQALRSTQHSASLPSRTAQIAMPVKETDRPVGGRPSMPLCRPLQTQRETTRSPVVLVKASMLSVFASASTRWNWRTQSLNASRPRIVRPPDVMT